jgi:hypothetical protein
MPRNNVCSLETTGELEQGLNLVFALIELCQTLLVMLVVSIIATVLEKGEPVARRGRKAAGLLEKLGRWPGRRRSDHSNAPESRP